jgi:integrase
MSIFKRGNVYWFNFWWDGRHVQRSTRQGNPKVARQVEAAFRTQLAKGEVGLEDREPVPTLQAFADAEFEPWVTGTFAAKEKTLAYYLNGLKRLAEFEPLWSAKLDQISGDRIASYVTKRQEKVCITSINRELQVLRRVLKVAEEWGRVGRTAKVKLLPGERRRERVLTRAEEKAYLAGAAEPLKTVTTLMLDTGVRPEEAFRLVWDHVNFKTRRVLVTHGKTAAARRSVPMSSRVFRMLARRWLKAGRPPGGWVLAADTESGHAEPSTVKKQHQKALAASKVAPFVLYTCRHTFLTRLGESGCDAWTLARVAGHATIGISARYVHAGDEAARSERLQKVSQLSLQAPPTDAAPPSRNRSGRWARTQAGRVEGVCGGEMQGSTAR